MSSFPAGAREILVAEEEEELRTRLARYLRRAGFQVRAVSSEREALDAIRAGAQANPRWTPDLIITEDQLPKGGGLALLQEVRREGFITPAILMSSSGRLWAEVATRLSSAFVVEKPVDLEQLVQSVELLV